jgi:large conductance mechanosensitive channel
MGFYKEFKEFAMQGNVMDMAVGLIIGAAFGKIVSSFVTDILMPPIGVAMGGVDFKDLAYVLQPAKEGMEAVAIRYGAFIQTILDFMIVALAIFVAIKIMNNLQKTKDEEPEEPEAPTRQEMLLTEIADLLRNR